MRPFPTFQGWVRSFFCVLLWLPRVYCVVGTYQTVFSLLVNLALPPRRFLIFLKGRHPVLVNSVSPELNAVICLRIGAQQYCEVKRVSLLVILISLG